MQHSQEIWEQDDDRQNLWESDPARAAMLAYLEVIAVWHGQVEDGVYSGIPALHRLPQQQAESADVVDLRPSTQRSRPARYAPDESAGHWLVPGEIRRRWLEAA